MKRSLKLGLGVLLIVVLTIAGGLYWAYNSLDHLVASAIRSYGSEITGVPVKVGSVDIELRDGSATLHDLSIGNPDGFKARHALELHEITLSIDIDSISSPVIVIKKFTLDSLDVNYETTQQGNNFDIIKGNINTYTAQFSSKKKSTEKDEGEKKGSAEKRFILKKVDITGGKVTAKSYLVPDKALDAKLPDIHLRNIGQASNGATPGQISKEIFGVIAKKSASAVAKAGVNDALDKLKSDSGEKLKGLFN